LSKRALRRRRAHAAASGYATTLCALLCLAPRAYAAEPGSAATGAPTPTARPASPATESPTASEDPGSSAIERPTVVAELHGPGADVAAVFESLRELAARLGVDLASEGASFEPFARVSVDLDGREASEITIVDARGQELARRSLPRQPSLEVLREEIAVIVSDALEAALAARRAEARPPPPTPAPPAAQREPSGPGPRLDATIFFAARSRDASGSLVPGAGLGLRLVAPGAPFQPSLGLTGEVAMPYDVNRKGVELRVSPYALRLRPSLSVPIKKSLSLEGAFGFGLDVVRVTPRGQDDDLVARAPTTKASPIVAPSLGLRLPIGGADLSVSAGVDIDLARRRYVVADPKGPGVALEPFALRPTLIVTIGLPLLGGARGRDDS
jgi:hypothetical protein